MMKARICALEADVRFSDPVGTLQEPIGVNLSLKACQVC